MFQSFWGWSKSFYGKFQAANKKDEIVNFIIPNVFLNSRSNSGIKFVPCSGDLEVFFIKSCFKRAEHESLMQGSSQKNDSSQSSGMKVSQGRTGRRFSWNNRKILLMEEIRRSPVDLGSLLPLFARF